MKEERDNQKLRNAGVDTASVLFRSWTLSRALIYSCIAQLPDPIHSENAISRV